MYLWTSPHGRPLPPIGGRTLIMGVLNATPDSFSDGGQLASPALAVERAGAMIAAGADLLDLGGESTRPGASTVSTQEELGRVLPVLSALRSTFPNIPISIDTYKAEVADRSIEQGADIINDVWGLTYGLAAADRDHWKQFELEPVVHTPKKRPAITAMAAVAARRKCPVILMHNRTDRNYSEFWADVLTDLKVSLSIAREAGIQESQIWLDPGFGFAKNVSQNLEILRHLGRICELGHPVLVGTSRKSTLGAVLGTRTEDRVEGGGATVVWAIQQGCQMIRVHDVGEMTRFARMADAIKAGLSYIPT